MNLLIYFLLIVSLLLIFNFFSLKYKLSPKANNLLLKIRIFFDSNLEISLKKDYKKTINILGISDLAVGLIGIIIFIIYILYKNNMSYIVKQIIYYILMFTSVIDFIIYNSKINNIIKK